MKSKIRHRKYEAGDVVQTNNYGPVEVVRYNSAIDIDLKWPDGSISKAAAAELRSGFVRHPTCGFLVGDKYTMNCGWTLEVAEYINAKNIRVKWQDGSESVEVAGNIKTGGIKPLNYPGLEGIGYFGIGKYVPGLYKEGTKCDPRVYGFWTRMFLRCYNPFELNKPKGAAYRDVFVHEDWHNFQNFAEWAYEQPFVFDKDVSLDKDLLSKGSSKIYSKDTCLILPNEINSFLIEGVNGSYYRGVNVIMPSKRCPTATIGYVARCCVNSSREYLGFYSTPEGAFEAYKKRKKEYGVMLAEKYKDKLPSKAYEALVNYEVESY